MLIEKRSQLRDFEDRLSSGRGALFQVQALIALVQAQLGAEIWPDQAKVIEGMLADTSGFLAALNDAPAAALPDWAAVTAKPVGGKV